MLLKSLFKWLKLFPKKGFSDFFCAVSLETRNRTSSQWTFADRARLSVGTKHYITVLSARYCVFDRLIQTDRRLYLCSVVSWSTVSGGFKSVLTSHTRWDCFQIWGDSSDSNWKRRFEKKVLHEIRWTRGQYGRGKPITASGARLPRFKVSC